MKKEKLKEIGRFMILWAIGLSIALLTSCVRVEEDCDLVQIRDPYTGYLVDEYLECYYY